MSEYLDVLDEHGVPTGDVIPRSEAHQYGIWHSTVHVYVYRIVDNVVEILVHLRAVDKEVWPNTWDPVFGGHVKAGCSLIETVVGELRDEANLSATEASLIKGPIIKLDKCLDREFNHIFLLPFPEDAVVRFNDQEVQEVHWMRLQAVKESIDQYPAKWRPDSSEFLVAHQAITKLLKV